MRLYTTPEASGILGVSTRTVKQYAAHGKIQAQKIGRAWRFTDEALRILMSGGTQDHPGRARLAAYVPMLAADLRTLRDRLEQTRANPEAITDLDDIITDYIKPMEQLATGTEA